MQNPENVGAGAYSYMNLIGAGVDRADVAAHGAGGGCGAGERRGDAKFYEAKLVTARFYAERLLPDAGALRRKIEGGSGIDHGA